MSKRHLAVLFLCSFAPFVVGSGALPLLVGRWSDRVGRTRFLLVSYLASAAGLVLLALSTSLWHFWVAVTVGTVIGFASTGHAVQRMGMLPTLIASAALPLVSIAVLLPVHRARAVAAAPQG